MTDNINTILISHAHKDEEYVAELVQLIKVTGVEEAHGIKIVCSSFPGHGIPGDVNIYKYLKEVLQGNVWVIYVLSQNYYSSAACLNEMGATWMQNSQYSTFLTPNFNFDKIKGAIDPARTAFILNNKPQLNDFKNKIISTFNTKVEDNIWESVRDTSLIKINTLAKQEREITKLEKIEFELVESISNEDISVTFRISNNNEYSVALRYFMVALKDSDGNIFSARDEPVDLRIHHNENKLIKRTYKINDSKFIASLIDTVNIKDARFTRVY